MLRWCSFVVVLFLSSQSSSAYEADAGSADGDTTAWEDIRPDIFGDRVIHDGAGLVELGAPFRSEVAALTPISVRTSLGTESKAVKLTLVIDENPSPVAAVFKFGRLMREVDLSTRVRVDRYSHVRAIVETDTGDLFMASSFVRASGGCAAPSVRDPAEASRSMGRIRLRHFESNPANGLAEAQVQISHPNYSGLQKDQVTLLYIPAHFVNAMEVSQGEETIFRMEGGISISENPSFRFRYDQAREARPVMVWASDTQGKEFSRSFPAVHR